MGIRAIEYRAGRPEDGIELKSLPFEVKAFDESKGSFAGHGAAFHNICFWGDILARGCFADTLETFLAEGFIGGINHDWSEPIGRPTAAREDEVGLYVEGVISDTAKGRDTRTLLKDGVIRSLSIGFRATNWVKLMTEEAVHEYWAEAGYTPNELDLARMRQACKSADGEEADWYRPGVRLIKALTLIEVSPVAVPANARATITDAKSGVVAPTTEREFERLLRDAGLSRKQAVAFVCHGYKGLQRDAVGDEGEPTQPPVQAKADPGEVARLFAAFQATEARLRGVPLE